MSHATTFVPCVYHCSKMLYLSKSSFPSVWGDLEGGSHRMSHVKGRLGSFQTARAEGHLWPLLGRSHCLF